MKKSLPLVFVIVIVIGFSIYYSTLDHEETSSTTLTAERLLEIADSTVERESFVNQILENPSQVVQMNSLIRKLTYSGDYSDDQVEKLVIMQRMLFSEILLDKNPEETHIQNVLSDIVQWQEEGIKIIGADQLTPEYKGDNMAIVKVVFYTNIQDRDLYADYGLTENDSGQWKIFVWTKTDPFEIVK